MTPTNGDLAHLLWVLLYFKTLAGLAPLPLTGALPVLHFLLLAVTYYSHFTDESDKCQGPYYDDMAITIRGHLYLTAAYSKERGNTLSTPGMGDTCWQTAQLFNEISNPSSHRLSAEGVKKTTSATGPAKAAGSFPITQNAPGGPTAEFFRTLIEGAFATTGLQANFDNAMTGYCSAPEGSEHHNDRYYGHDGLNAGWALVVMGETSISSMKSNLKVEETGQCTAHSCNID